MQKIILEISHQMPPKAWVSNSKQHFIEMTRNNDSYSYGRFDKKAAFECWGDNPDDWPPELFSIINSGNVAVEIGDDYVLESDAEPEIEYAHAFAFDDLNSHRVFSIEDAKAFSSGKEGFGVTHGLIQARKAVKDALEWVDG